MPIIASEVKFFKSAHVGTDAITSLGGAITVDEVQDGILHDLFDPIDPTESTTGDVEYRCIYVQNTNATLDLQSAVLYIQANTPSADTDIAIGLDPAGVNNDATTVADEGTAPAGVAFSAPGQGAPLALGTLAPNARFAFWIRRTVTAGAVAAAGDNVILQVDGISDP